MRPNPPLRFAALLALSLFVLPWGGVGAQERPIIVIDAGHGGDEAGVVEGELVEKDLVLRLALTTAATFVREGFDVRLTRTGDYAVPWAERRERAEAVDASLLIMLHMIRSDDPARHGAEIYFSDAAPASVRAASEFGSAMEAEEVEVLLEPRSASFLESPTVPTVMIEAGFLTNPVERRFLQADAYHRALADMFVEAARAVMGS